MTLNEYMKAHTLSDCDMAAILDCSEGAVRKWRYGERVPRPDQLRRIQEQTGGAVTPNDFVSPAASTEAAA